MKNNILVDALNAVSLISTASCVVRAEKIRKKTGKVPTLLTAAIGICSYNVGKSLLVSAKTFPDSVSGKLTRNAIRFNKRVADGLEEFIK